MPDHMMFSETEITLQFQKKLKYYSGYPAGFVCIIGMLVLLGWRFDIEFLKRIIPGLVAMNPVSAITFMLAGITMVMVKEDQYIIKNFYSRKGISLLISLIGLTCLLSNVTGIKGGIDHWLFTEKLMDEVSHIQNRMAPNTAFNFIITGLSLFFLDHETKKKYKIAQYLILVVALISLLSIIGYIYGVRSFYGVLTYIPMAIHTSLCFLLISCSVLLASCDKGLMADFTNNYVGSILARKLLPAIIAVPILVGFLIIYGEKSGWYVTHFGTALFTATNILIFAYLLKRAQTSINKSDIARTNAEMKLMELNMKLEERGVALEVLNSELESFSYSISHDLRAPLRSIQGYTKILQDNFGSSFGEEGTQTMNTIIRNTNKMSQLIEDLLEFSRVRRKEMLNSFCDMEQLVTTVLKSQHLTLKRKEYEIKINELYSCSGDPSMMEQVWANLISNALKYSSKNEKPVIEIGSYKNKDENVYFVKDNGVGFDMAYVNKLFAVFQRLHTAADFEGTGIGLAIVYKIVTRHGGKVWTEAKRNEGASFYFSLPVSK